MRIKEFLVRAVAAQPRPVEPDEDVARAISSHIRKSLSKESITKAVRDQLAQRHRSLALQRQLLLLEEELQHIEGARSARAAQLQQRIADLKKKL